MSPMDDEKTKRIITAISRTCDDLRHEFEVLANQAAPALNDLTSAIGSLTQYEVERYILTLDPSETREGGILVEYWDTPPRWWDWALDSITSVREVPHPRRAEVQEKLKELSGEVETNDKIFNMDVTSIVATPQEMGCLITEWLGILIAFTEKVAAAIPSNAAYIPTRGDMDGWLSSSASKAYDVTISTQNAATKTAREVMNGLITNCATFLESILNWLSDFANITQAQNAFYLRVFELPLQGKPSYDTVMKLIREGIDLALETRRLEEERSATLGRNLTASIIATLEIEKLDLMITDMGERTADGGWPGPATMTIIENDATPTEKQLRYNIQYFHDHAVFWREVSAELAALKSEAEKIPEISQMFTRVREFSANRSDALNGLSADITTKVLGKGASATEDIATKLDETIGLFAFDRGALAGQAVLPRPAGAA